ncbi:MAG: MFS transporter [Thermomicrobiales bacterium]
MHRLLLNRAFARFWLAGLFFLVASWALHATMLIYVFQLTGSAFATGLIPVFSALPIIVLGPIAGVLVDRWNRRLVMSRCSIILAGLLLLAIPFASNIGAPALFTIILVQAMLMTFFSPAENALLPTLVDQDDLAAANSRNALNDSLARIGGPAIGAWVLVQFGFASTLAVCAVLYLLGWTVLAGLQHDDQNERRLATPRAIGFGPMMHSFGRELMVGVHAVRRYRPILIAVIVFALFMVADVALSAVLPAFMIDSVGVTPQVFGTLMSVRGLTGLLGGLVVVVLSRRVHEERLLVAGLLVHGASVLTFGLSNNLIGSILILVPIGPAAAAIQTGLFTMLQKGSVPAMRGRVFALVGMVNGLITILVSLGGGSLGEAVGTRIVVIMSGCLYIIPIAVMVAWLRSKPEANQRIGPEPGSAAT